jgi:hypothetical protein
MCISALSLITALPCYYPLHIIYLLHLLSCNYKCTQPCYFLLLLKPIVQKMMVDWNSSMRSSSILLPRLLTYGLWNLPVICLCHSHRSL